MERDPSGFIKDILCHHLAKFPLHNSSADQLRLIRLAKTSFRKCILAASKSRSNSVMLLILATVTIWTDAEFITIGCGSVSLINADTQTTFELWVPFRAPEYRTPQIVDRTHKSLSLGMRSQTTSFVPKYEL